MYKLSYNARGNKLFTCVLSGTGRGPSHCHGDLLSHLTNWEAIKRN